MNAARPSGADRLYGRLLRVYPRAFRERFARGMRYAFTEELREAARRGRGAVLRLWLRTLVHAVIFGIVERISGGFRRKFPVDPSPTRRGASMSEFVREMRYAVRRLVRRPGFTLAVVATLALGIGATTAIFSVVQGVILDPLPYPEGDRIVRVHHRSGPDHLAVPDGGYFYYSDNASTLADLAVYLEISAPVTGAGEPLELGIVRVTPSFFSVLGLTPALGRIFTTDDARPGVPDIAIISYDFWMERFGGDPGVLGRTVIEGGDIEIVGVMPPEFDFIRPKATIVFGNSFDTPDLLLPLTLDRSDARFGNFIYQGIGRLAPGATAEEANRELRRLMMEATEAFPGGHTVASLEEGGHAPVVTPLKQAVVGDVARVLWMLLGAVGVILLIATANVANLFLVRADARRREIAVQQALGAGRRALAGSFFAESAVLAAAGGVLGVMSAVAGTGVLLRLAPADIPRLDQVGMDLRVLGFAAAVSLVTGIACGLFPLARFARLDVRAAVSDESRGGTAGRQRQRTRHALVVIQVALALVLVVGSVLLIRTVQNLRRVDSGFDPANVLTLRLSLHSSSLLRSAGIEFSRGDVGRTRFMLALTERLEGLPGVRGAAFTADLPLDGDEWRDAVAVEGALPEEGMLGPEALRVFMGPGYLETIGARLVRGRELERRDFVDFPRAAVVNQAFAEQRWPGEQPIGKRIAQWDRGADPSTDIWYTVVGVVDDIREASLMVPTEPTVYLPTVFLPDSDFSMFVSNMVLVLRTSGDPLAVLSRVRREIWAFQPEVPINSVLTLEQVEARSMQQVTFAMVLLVIAGSVALLLGIVGIYGVVAYVVSQRRREFGVRIALGATAGNVRRSVLRQGGLAGALGIMLGLGGAMASSRILESLLFGVAPMEPVVYGGVSVGLLVVVLLGTLLPAQRAAMVDPVEAIRAE